MKRLILLLFTYLLLQQNLFAFQTVLQGDNDKYFICMNSNNTVIIGEQINFSNDENGVKEHNMSEALLKKYAPANSTTVFFPSYKNEFKELTNIMPGGQWYISSWNGVYESKITGYLIDMPVTMYEFYPVLEKPNALQSDNNNADKNIYIAAADQKLGKIKLGIGHNESTDPGIYKTVREFEKTIMTYDEYVNVIPEIKIIQGNYINSGSKEFAVSYVKHIKFDSFASGIIITNESGEIIKELSALTNSNFNYYRIVGAIDLNKDDQDELLVETGYYEGIGYELWKYSNGKFEKITGGFYWGL